MPDTSSGPHGGSAATTRAGDPLYYLWSACWAALCSAVVLFSLIVSLLSAGSGVWVHVTQVGQVILFVFLAWFIPKGSLKLLHAGKAGQSVRGLLATGQEDPPDTGWVSFLARWLRLWLPRKTFSHESLRIAPMCVLAVVLVNWGSRTSGQVSAWWAVALIALIVVLMISVVPLIVFGYRNRRSK